MNIAFDIDGVLTDFQFFLDAYGRRYLSEKHKKEIKIYKQKAEFRERFNCSEKDHILFYLRYLYWYSLRFPIREHASDYIKKIKEEGHKVYIITARVFCQKKNILGKLMRVCVKKWLKDNGIEYDAIYYVSEKNTYKEKAELAKELDIDIFVEDTVENIDYINKYCKTICLAADYNCDVKNSIRVEDFNEVYDCILEYEEELNDYESMVG